MRLAATPWTRRNFARWLFEDYPRAVMVTPRRWRRRLFTGPGRSAENPAPDAENLTKADPTRA